MRGGLLALILLASSAARADVDVEAAKAHFAVGQHDFEAGRFADALAEFESAYRLSGRAPLLYNIGICHERLGHADAAIDAFERYLREAPETPDRRDVEERVRGLRDRQRLTTVPLRGVAATAPAASDRVPVYRRGWFWGVVGGATAAVIAGVTVGVVLGTRDSTRVLPDVRAQ